MRLTHSQGNGGLALPEAAQGKLIGRSKARDALGGLNRLINEDESRLI